MKHLTNIKDIEQVLAESPLCLFFIKAPDCGVCNVMLDKVGLMADNHPQLESFEVQVLSI